MSTHDDSGSRDRDKNAVPARAEPEAAADAAAKTESAKTESAKTEPAEKPEPGKKPEADKSLLSIVNSAAQRIQALWISFISFGAYLTITVLGTTHLKLFLAEPVKLPVFAIDLPLTNFYFVAPTFFLIFHFYLLTQLILLARTIGTLESEFSDWSDDEQDAVRMQLDNSIFVQMIAGARPERKGGNAWFIRLTAWLTVIWLPLLLLLLFELQFLPYHLEWLTNYHRILLSVDLILLWTLWPLYRWGQGLWAPHLYVDGSVKLPRRCLMFGMRALPGLSLLAIAWLVAVFPGEGLYGNWFTRLPSTVVQLAGKTSGVGQWLLSWRTNAERIRGARLQKPIATFSFTELLLEPSVDYVAGEHRGFFSNTISLPDKKFVDDKIIRELDEVEKDNKPGEFRTLPSLSFRGRNFEQAILSRTDLRRSDFTGAVLNGANFEGASLQRSRFGCADRGPGAKPQAKNSNSKNAKSPATGDANDSDDDSSEEDSLSCAQLNLARLDGAHLQSIDFAGAELRGASILRAELDGAVFDRVKAQGASFFTSRAASVSFIKAKLQGASLSRVSRLDLTNFSYAELQGASLFGITARGANFKGANLQGASFAGANLQAAVFSNADLQGAAFRRASLQGATFDEADLSLVTFEYAKLWRIGGTPVKTDSAKWDHVDFSARPFAKFETWRSDIVDRAGGDGIWAESLSNFEALDPKQPDPQGFNGWRDLATKSQSTPSGEQDRKIAAREAGLAKLFEDLACGADNAPYVARRLILVRRIAETGAGKQLLAQKLRGGTAAGCPGGVGLNDFHLSQLSSQVLPPSR
ncbi:pentapeptide repeat-containing protein [Bradyrhizobium sp. UNPF46]|uniref:pentapeptide repeat-containing protein n=1 Tax=Bradyrhizobium sp. UNPF46 TaxID=1141168 RepID=UPI00115061EC|nr:pentapeptide repeat-containing protein [Bradyrhizobium sp. UNPF46]